MAGSGKWVVAALCGGLLLMDGPARACNVPVFRYALEHWATDPYEAVVFHRGPLSAADQAAVALLEKAAAAAEPSLTLRVADLDQRPEDSLRELFETQQAATLSWLVVRYPTATRVQGDAWAGPLHADTVRALLDSPARREVARRLRTGDSAVWVLLEGGTKEQDDAADELLRSQLHALQETLQLPPQTDAPDDPPGQADLVPLRLAFSALRVSRTDPAEALLVQLLLHTEPDLAERHEAMVFPVFGRGRVLYALVGAGITADNLRETATFLTGACSCKVKRENPGIDLLLPADWHARPDTDSVNEPKPTPASPVAEGRAAPPVAADEPSAEPDPSASTGLAGLLGLLLVLALVSGAALFVRRRHPWA